MPRSVSDLNQTLNNPITNPMSSISTTTTISMFMFIQVLLLAMSFTSSATNTFSSPKLSSNISCAPSLLLSLLDDSLLVVEVLIGLPAIKATLFVDITSPFTFVWGNYFRFDSLSSSEMNATDALCVKPLLTDLDLFCRYSNVRDGAIGAEYLFDFFLNFNVQKPVPFARGSFPGSEVVNDIDGILGLGSGHPVNLVEQLRNTTLGRFSYCIPSTLIRLDNSSRAAPTLDFGVEAAYRGQEWINTTLVRGTFGAYYLNVTSILVQDRPLVVKPQLFWPNNSGGGGFILQSKSPFTTLLPQVYDLLKQAVIAYFWQSYQVDPCTQPSTVHLDLCYDLRHFKQGGGPNKPQFHAPSIELELEFGVALLEFPKTFVDFPEANETCLMMLPLYAGEDRSSLGTVQQLGHRFLVDIPTSTLSFSPNQC